MSETLALTAVVLLTVAGPMAGFTVGRPENAHEQPVTANGPPMATNSRTGPPSVYVRFGFVHTVRTLCFGHEPPSFWCGKHFETSDAGIAGSSSNPPEPFRVDGNGVVAASRTRVENHDGTMATTPYETSYVAVGERRKPCTVEAATTPITTSEDPTATTVVWAEDAISATVVDGDPDTKAFDCCFDSDNTTGTAGFTAEDDDDDHHDRDRGYDEHDRDRGYDDGGPSISSRVLCTSCTLGAKLDITVVVTENDTAETPPQTTGVPTLRR